MILATAHRKCHLLTLKECRKSLNHDPVTVSINLVLSDSDDSNLIMRTLQTYMTSSVVIIRVKWILQTQISLENPI